MADKPKTEPKTTEPKKPEPKKDSGELSDEELDKAAGGMGDMPARLPQTPTGSGPIG